MDQERLQHALEGRYSVEGEVGRGGMATVYRALDHKHGRTVAVKVLDPDLGAVLGAERFLSEIRVTAALQHPNLLPLFDSGEADGLLYYVMPLVEGESLRARLDREKQLGVDEAIRMTVAIASALEYAHSHGVIHRDLKPENILLQAGQPVIADFGIALAVSRAGGARVTQTGLSLGTPQYMSPEQATGDRGIDARTDQYSLAAICYELLAGEPPHIGTTAQAIIAKLMTEAPRPVTLLRKTVPPHVSAALSRALEKLPADRFDSVRDFALALQGQGGGALQNYSTANATPTRPVPAWRRWAVSAVVPLLVAAAGVAGVWVGKRQAPEVPLLRVAVLLPDSAAPAGFSRFVVSSSGRYLAYVSDDTGGRTLWLKHRDEPWPRRILRSNGIGSSAIAFSDDESRLMWVENSSLRRASIEGSGAVTIADDAAGGSSLTVARGDSIAYIATGGIELHLVSPAGGTPRVLWRSDSGTLTSPRVVPGGSRVLVTQCRGASCVRGSELVAVDLATGDRKVVAEGVVNGGVFAPGILLVSKSDGTLQAARVDLKTLARQSDFTVVQDGIETFNRVPVATVGADGSLLMRQGGVVESSVTYTLQWVDRKGIATPVDPDWHFRLTNYGSNGGWALSPDGRRLAIGLNTKSGDDIWIKELPKGPLSRLTFDALAEVRPRWSRDAKHILYVTAGGISVASGLARRLANGSGDAEQLVANTSGGPFEVVQTPDARQLLIRQGGTVNVVNGRDVYVTDVDSAGRPGSLKPLLADSTIDEAGIALSPDGRWLAYESNETGRTEVFVRPYPNVAGGRWQVSTDGGQAPLWNRNGRELFYVDAQRMMVAARLTPTADDPGVNERTPLFRLPSDLYLSPRERYTPYDVSADGQRFLMARADQAEARRLAPIILTSGWLREVEKKLGLR